jgi:Secretion system C-terminal sorting domain
MPSGTYLIFVKSKNSCGSSLPFVKTLYLPTLPCDFPWALSVSPNPSSENITISVKDSEQQEISAYFLGILRLKDLSGNLRLELQNVTRGDQINLSNLQNGLYKVEFIIENQVLSTLLLKNNGI